jgi:hypothetical protein
MTNSDLKYNFDAPFKFLVAQILQPFLTQIKEMAIELENKGLVTSTEQEKIYVSNTTVRSSL